MEHHGYDEKRKRYTLSPEEIRLRKEFVRKVILITLGQLFCTLCATIPTNFIEPIRKSINDIHWLLTVLTVTMVAFTLIMMFCSWIGRVRGVNYLVLFTLTLITTLWLACFCIKYDHTKVTIAIIITVVISTGFSFAGAFISRDFTVLYGILFTVTFIALILGLFYFLWPNPRLKWAILIGSLILTCVYVMSDTQLIIIGDRTFYLDFESHVLGAAILYVDLIYLFVYWLCIIGDYEGFKLKY